MRILCLVLPFPFTGSFPSTLREDRVFFCGSLRDSEKRKATVRTDEVDLWISWQEGVLWSLALDLKWTGTFRPPVTHGVCGINMSGYLCHQADPQARL